MNRYILFCSILLTTVSSALSAQTLEVLNFKKTDRIDARINKVKNNNNEDCALLVLSTALDGENMSFDSSLGICKVEPKVGEVWVYISPQERKLSVAYPLFEKLDYIFKSKIESKTTYQATLRGDVIVSQQVTKKLPGILVVKSNPSGAQVYIDGKFTGQTTPFQKPLKTGEHTLTLKKELHQDISQNIEIQYEQTLRRTIKLKPNYGTLEIVLTKLDYNPSLTIDGKVTSIPPDGKLKLNPGNYKIKLSAEGYKEIIREANIPRGKKYTVRANPEPLFAMLNVPSVSGATLKINGTKTKFGSTKVYEGINTIEVTKKNFKDYKTSVEIVGGKNQTHKVQLEAIMTKVQFSFENADAKKILIGKQACTTPCYLQVPLGKNVVSVSGKPSWKAHAVKVSEDTKSVNLLYSDFGQKSPAMFAENVGFPTLGQTQTTQSAPKIDYSPSYTSEMADRLVSLKIKKYVVNTIGYGSAIAAIGLGMRSSIQATRLHDAYKQIPRQAKFKLDIENKWEDLREARDTRDILIGGGIAVGVITWFIHMNYNDKISRIENSWYSSIDLVNTDSTIGIAINF